ncbi:MAG: tRNA (N6-isopentenyl adenosine(37)-C2)-methylthiotransferase MiaB [Bacilli bacterium]|nr:tRNA (N6-isopentenyl adenosine(37)-C2)-methylthiotransferase MiaB [Bacilli bacterium]MDD4734159.1 tRNA (N6-isopentenyl adenosine(37)-C2)-methylthiotransferase MiaB [Bacilli bacterium]
MLRPNLKDAKIRTKDLVLKENYKLDKEYISLGQNMTYHIKTYGCQMNEHDTENIKAILEQMGFKEEKIMENADFILLNTCAIRENAHNKVFGMLGRIKHLRESKPNIIVGMCGCMPQQEVVVERIIKKYKWMDIIFGTHNIYELPKLLNKSLAEKKQVLEVMSCEGNIVEGIPAKRDSNYKAWVNIMYGCDKFCTYCIVPYTRGKQRSRALEDIVKEVIELKENNYKEVTLLGQNVNAYGKDLNEDYNMANLLEEVAKTNIERIRFVTSHPWDFNDDMIEVIKKYKNVMPYIHLPLQSGSNKILKLMGRRYSKEDYLTLFNKLKEAVPNCSITTDIIVGFPGEEEVDFEDTLELVNKCKFDSAFTFIFSAREGTPAAKMEDSIPLEEKERRLYLLNDLINKYSKEANGKYLNKKVPVLLESVSEKDKNKLMGYTDTMKLVNVKTDLSNLGKIIDVKITNVKTWSMDGEEC